MMESVGNFKNRLLRPFFTFSILPPIVQMCGKNYNCVLCFSLCPPQDALASSPRCCGFSGADLADLVNRAARFRLEEISSSSSSTMDAVVSLAHFQRALEVVGPSVTGAQKRRYDDMKRRFDVRSKKAKSKSCAVK